ncbi:unnamed protein product [Owenia fusiformis]|uniref:Cornichon n=1 Tax=Owenia fusiformis TaxID=6347 RepID=A0A8J1Y5U8_OWEFU|nr:unnamed protein product [Owenia fusiformis]
MELDTPVLIFGLVDGTTLLFLTVYFVITLSDLECDYLNARSCCEKLNMWVLPEIVAHSLITVLLLLSLHWVLFLLNLPLAVFQINKYLSKPSGSIGVYDPTEIHNRQLLKSYMKESMVKLGFHLVFFFIYLYSMILALVGD